MSHYYDSEGNPRHFEAPNGRATTIREARNLNLLPSVTTVISEAIPKPGLEKWKVRTALEAALTLPRLPNESEHDFADRALADSREQSEKAKDAGSAIHKAIEDRIGPHADEFHALLADLHWSIVWQEKVLVGPDYAGRADLLVQDGFGQTILVDLKGQEWDGKKPRVYDEWAIQLAAYNEVAKADCCVSMVFHRKDPKLWHVHSWPKKDIERFWHAWFHALQLWKVLKNYDPKREGVPV